MKILALETSGAGGGVAAIEDDRVLHERQLALESRTAQTLAPAIRDLLRDCRWRPREVDLVAVAVGPGSFTGLRLGVTTAKVFAYAAGAEVLGVDTLQVIAAQASRAAERLVAVMHAERQQLFSADFQRDADGQLTRLSESRIVDIAAWLDDLPAGTVVTGPALSRIAAQLPGDVEVIDSSLWTPSAAVVGQLAGGDFRAGRRDDAWSLVPLYLRRSAAEEQREQKEAPR